jgi:hypothetical protein
MLTSILPTRKILVCARFSSLTKELSIKSLALAARSVLPGIKQAHRKEYRSRTENAPGCPENGLKKGPFTNAKG